MSRLSSFISDLQKLLVNKEDVNNSIIRRHTKKLEDLGDLSFPVEINSWYNLLHSKNVKLLTVFEYASLLGGKTLTECDLINESQSWALKITKCVILKHNCHLFIDRPSSFKKGIEDVLRDKTSYGKLILNISVNLNVDCPRQDGESNLSELRMQIVKQVTENLINFCNEERYNNNLILLTTKSSSMIDGKNILCGPVLDASGRKNKVTTPAELYKQRAVDMQLMAQHKYGLRVTSKPGWSDIFNKLGKAAVTIDFLQNKLSSSITIDLNNHYLKNASFVLYNCARLAKLIKEFENKVEMNTYPPLPPLDDIDFTLLTQPEEWELLFVYVLQFPDVIKNCIKDVEFCKINVHYLVSSISSMSSAFSVYYRRVRILTEPRPHLFPILFARMYLIKTIEQVLHNGLRLLDIEPVHQM